MLQHIITNIITNRAQPERVYQVEIKLMDKPLKPKSSQTFIYTQFFITFTARKNNMLCNSQRTATMFVGVVALRYQHHRVPQLPQT